MSQIASIEELGRKDSAVADLLDSIFDGVYIVDKKRIIIFWNKGAEIITGHESKEVVGRRCADNLLNHIDENGNLLCKTACPLLKTMVSGEPGEMKVYPLHKSGKRIPTRTHTSAIRDSSGEVIGGIEVFRDITQEEDFRILQQKFNDLVKKYVSIATLEEIKSQLKFDGVQDTKLKDLTILYLDIVSFSTFSEQKAPEEVIRMLNEIFGICEVITKEYHGDIDKFIGDAVMAVFIDANDAVKASQSILKALAKNNDERKKDQLEPIRVRIGINSGKVIQGDVGTSERKDLTVIGDVVNTASRIQTIADPDTIFISESTYSRLKNPEHFKFEREVTVKGKSEPIRIFSSVP